MIDVELLPLHPVFIFLSLGVHSVLRHQLERHEEERAEEKTNLTSKCEKLQLSQLQQQKRETAEEGGTTPHRAAESTVQTDPEEAGATANSGTDSSSDTTRRLDYWKKIFFVMLQELSQTKKPSRTITLI